MNWQQLIEQFQPLSVDAVEPFANRRDMEQALRLYNKSLEHIRRDSADIAIIALRRLASDYPRFGMAPLLAACLLAQDDAYEEALILVKQAIEQGELDDTWLEEAKQCSQSLEMEMNLTAETEKPGNTKPRRASPAIDTNTILEKIKRSDRVKMASERERQELLRRGEQSEEETFVENPRQLSDYVRLAVPFIGGIVLLVLIIFAGTRLAALIRNDQDREDDSLSWLLARLEQMASEDEAIDDLLDEFSHRFSPSATNELDPDHPETRLEETEQPGTETDRASETAETDEPDSDEPVITSSPTISDETEDTPVADDTDLLPTPEPTTDPDVLLMEQAETFYQTALQLQSDDIMAAMDQLFIVRTILESLSPDTWSEQQSQNAGELFDEVTSLMEELARPAANAYRIQGRSLFDQRDYEAALVYYLKAFELDPLNYGGGTAYYTGRSFQELGQFDTARFYFEFVVENFSGRDIAGFSANRLRDMGF